MPESAPHSTRAGRIETLGAWLGVWTPRRGVVVPPPPSARRVAFVALAVFAVAGGLAAVIVPVLAEIRDRNARETEERLKATYQRRVAAQRVEQLPRDGRLARRADRQTSLRAVETTILADARSRFDDRSRRVACEPYPRTVDRRDPGLPVGAYACLAVTSDIDNDPERGSIGIPYFAIVDFRKGRYSFCKIHPIPGEESIPDPSRVVRLPPECDPNRIER